MQASSSGSRVVKLIMRLLHDLCVLLSVKGTMKNPCEMKAMSSDKNYVTAIPILKSVPSEFLLFIL